MIRCVRCAPSSSLQELMFRVRPPTSPYRQNNQTRFCQQQDVDRRVELKDFVLTSCFDLLITTTDATELCHLNINICRFQETKGRFSQDKLSPSYETWRAIVVEPLLPPHFHQIPNGWNRFLNFFSMFSLSHNAYVVPQQHYQSINPLTQHKNVTSLPTWTSAVFRFFSGREGSKVLKQVLCCCSIWGALGSLLLTASCRGVTAVQHTHTEREREQVSGLMRLVYRRVFLLRQEVYHVAHKKQD